MLEWTAVPGASRYVVFRNGKRVRTQVAHEFRDPTAGFGLLAYQVAAKAHGKMGPRSHEYTIVYQATPPPASGIVLSGPSPTTQAPLVMWHTVSGADRYVVYRDGRRIDEVDAAETSYTDNGVGAGKYAYQVAWIHARVESQLSKPHTIDYRPVTPLGLPAPTGLYGTTPTTEPPSLTWNLVDGAGSYDVYRDADLVGPQTTPPFTDTNASTGPHDYVVTARAGDAESDPSKPYRIDYVLLPAPTGVHSTSKITELPAFAWNAVTGADGYVVYRDDVALPEVYDPSYREPDVSNPPASHTYFVRAVNREGVQGDASESITITYTPATDG